MLLPRDAMSLARGAEISAAACLQMLLHLYLGEGLDDVACLYVVAVDERDTAFQTGSDLLGVVLVTLEGIDAAGEDDYAVADKARLVRAVYLAVGDDSAGNGADLGNLP